MAGCALVLPLVPFSYRVERRLETAVHIRGGEAEAVDRELAERFTSLTLQGYGSGVEFATGCRDS